jgi:hypothetical protein
MWLTTLERSRTRTPEVDIAQLVSQWPSMTNAQRSRRIEKMSADEKQALRQALKKAKRP